MYSGLSIELMILKNNPETLTDVEIILVLGRAHLVQMTHHFIQLRIWFLLHDHSIVSKWNWN